MSTQKAVSGNVVRNNGGAAMNAGTDLGIDGVIGSRLYSSRPNVGAFGSTVIDGDTTDPILFLGRFAETNEIVAKRVSTSLANIATPALLSGASDPTKRKSIARMEAVRTVLWSTAFRANRFSLYTGRFENGYPQVSVDDAIVTVSGVYQDQAANPTRQIPGELVYRTGAKTPVTADYSAKNG